MSAPETPPSVNRRTFLAAAGTGAVATLSGCLAGLTRSVAPAETEEEPRETHLLFRARDDHLATVSFLDRWDLENRRWPYPIRLHVWHAEGTHLESLRYVLRPRGTRSPVEVYLRRPGGYPWEPITFRRGEDDPNATVIDVPDLGFQGRGSVTLDLLIESPEDEPFGLEVAVEATLDPGAIARDYRLEGHVTREVPGLESRSSS